MRLSTLLRFLRGSTKLNQAEPEDVHYWEDDYCQIELVPKESKPFIERELQALDEFAQKHWTSQGYTALYERANNPFPTSSNEIIFRPLETLILESGLRYAKALYYEGELAQTTKIQAFGNRKFAICLDTEKGLVENIWLISRHKLTVEEAQIPLNALYQIGETYDLILIDWSSNELVDLQNRNQIIRYLTE